MKKEAAAEIIEGEKAELIRQIKYCHKQLNTNPPENLKDLNFWELIDTLDNLLGLTNTDTI